MRLVLLVVSQCLALPQLTSKDVVDKSVKSVDSFLTEADFESHTVEVDLRSLGIPVKDDPTLGSKAEGDIDLPSPKAFVEESNQQTLARNAIRQSYRRWPNSEIPYTLSSQYGPYARSIIAKAMKEYHDKTCIRFVPRDSNRHRDFVDIHPDDGCYSLVGRTGGRQPLSLDSGCIQVGTIVHELMHAVGFFHEQSRTDRDQFIEIVWRNVVKGANDQFEKYSPNIIDLLNEPYDYGSIMHYGPYAFSGSGKKTIVPRQAGSERMGQRVAFSAIDLRKINRLYGCEQRNSGSQVTTTRRPLANRPLPPIYSTRNPLTNHVNNRVRIFG